MQGKLFLIPAPISDANSKEVIPPATLTAIRRIEHFIVEDLKSARRYLFESETALPVEELDFAVLNEHTKPEEISAMLRPALNGCDMGLLSDAGMPCTADPGEELVAIAHRCGIKVVPMVGPSSLILALAASGLNGERFSFEGYLPVKTPELIRRLKHIEQQSIKEKKSIIFIETPYRNSSMINTLVNTLSPRTEICIACNITAKEEFIATKPAGEWKKQLPDVNKKPCIFIIEG